MNKIKFQINNKNYFAKTSETILDVALREKIEIPHLCKHPDLEIKANCRTCLVEVEKMGLVTSCSTKVKQGMKVKTDTKKVNRARKINLELIFAEHIEKCDTCVYENNCVLLKYAKQYDLKINRFFDRKINYPIWQFGDSIQFDSSKCIDCRNCVEVCEKMQTCNFLKVAERGVETIVKPKDANVKLGFKTQFNSNNSLSLRRASSNFKKNTVDLLGNNPDKFDCTYCGQCVVHCPTGAISEVLHFQDVEKLLENRGDKILIAQIAPSIRVSIGEEFNQEPGKIVTGQLAASIKKLGFDYAFDVNLGADFTTFEEAQELIHWLETKKEKPMFTSCCPAWVKFVEFYYPEFISHLTTTKPPQICSATLIKTYFAKKIKKDPKDIIVVSIMPCTAKKHESNLKKFYINNLPVVDFVLTTREYSYLLRKHKIDLPNLKPQDLDKPLGIYSGSAAIYGASGGVMESALRSADYFLASTPSLSNNSLSLRRASSNFNKLQDQNIQSRIDFKEIRGMQGIKIAKIKINNKKLNVAVINGLGNARNFLDNLKNKKSVFRNFDYVEIMACPGGCIGGGGQPIPTDSKIRKKRADALYEISKNLPIKTAHENPALLEIYKNYFKNDKKLIEKMLHSKFEPQEKQGYFQIN